MPSDGIRLSPPLEWSGAPQGTRSFAVVMFDPDAPGGTWDHWVAWNLEPSLRALPLGAQPAHQGTNSWGEARYGGPNPPPGDGAHRYVFRLYALDCTLDLPRTTTRAQLEKHVKGHVLDKADLMGKYARLD